MIEYIKGLNQKKDCKDEGVPSFSELLFQNLSENDDIDEKRRRLQEHEESVLKLHKNGYKFYDSRLNSRKPNKSENEIHFIGTSSLMKKRLQQGKIRVQKS